MSVCSFTGALFYNPLPSPSTILLMTIKNKKKNVFCLVFLLSGIVCVCVFVYRCIFAGTTTLARSPPPPRLPTAPINTPPPSPPFPPPHLPSSSAYATPPELYLAPTMGVAGYHAPYQTTFPCWALTITSRFSPPFFSTLGDGGCPAPFVHWMPMALACVCRGRKGADEVLLGGEDGEQGKPRGGWV